MRSTLQVVGLSPVFWVLTLRVLLGAVQAEAQCVLVQGEHGVVEARAADRLESYECFGRAHARFRGEQMRLLRQVARGRMAEEKGPSFIKGDFVMRVLELERRADRIAAGLSPEDRGWLEAYARGVNAEGAGSLAMDPWRVRDTILLLLVQSFDQTRRSFQQDLVNDEHARKGHPLKAQFPWQTPILKKGEYPEAPATAAVAVPQLYPFAPEDEAVGSNNWVVSPRFSKKKVALLANDPHLALKDPPFWHWVRLKYGRHEIVGGSLPGVPVIASGGSRRMAWGLTNSYVDVADAVLVPQKGPDGHALRTRRERPVIWFKLGWFRIPFVFKSYQVLEPADIPVVPLESPEKGHVIAIRWTGFDVTAGDLGAIWRFHEALDVAEMDAMLGRLGLPSWNYVFADVKGNIGYRAVGRLPRRNWQDRGKLPVLSPADLGPLPVLTADEAPHVINPPRGWVATANQLQWGPEGRVSVGQNHTEAFRGFRIEELLRQGLASGHDLESFQRIICDRQAVDARFLLPVLLNGMGPRVDSRIAARLSGWDLETGLECRECALFRLWMRELGDAQWIHARATQGSEEERAGFFAEAAVALERAVSRLEPLGGPWVRWGDVHRALFPGPEAVRPFTRSANGTDLATPGDDHSVSPGSSDFIEEKGRRFFSHHSGASQRVIWEMTSPPRAHFVVPGDEADRRAWSECRFFEL